MCAAAVVKTIVTRLDVEAGLAEKASTPRFTYPHALGYSTG